jgi:transcriptional regulator with XRE-family HTH domain
MDTQEIKSLFGRNVKYFRYHRQLSQAELAEKADISVTFLSNIERGKMFPKAEVMARLTEGLDVDVFELFRTTIIPEDSKIMLARLSKDIYSRVSSTLDDIFKSYYG